MQFFDLLTFRGQAPPMGYSSGDNSAVDSLAGFNVHSLVLEVPIAHVTNGVDPVIGLWAGTRRPSTRVLGGLGGRPIPGPTRKCREWACRW